MSDNIIPVNFKPLPATAVCFSDTHLRIPFDLPKAQFGIMAGDACNQGSEGDLREFVAWYARQDVVHKIYVPGNHDIFCEHKMAMAKRICEINNIILLHNAGVTLDGISFWGTATQPFFCNWAFNVMDARDRAIDFSLIPANVDVLVTHCPPYGILDQTPPTAWNNRSNDEHVGCHALLTAVRGSKPRFHIFGHIHHSYGQITKDGTFFVNAAVCTEQYKQTNPPIMVDLNDKPEPITFEGA